MPFAVKVDNENPASRLTPEQLQKAIAERADHMNTLIKEAGPTYDPALVKAVEMKDGSAFATYIRNLNDELTALGKRTEDIESIEAAKAQADRLQKWGSEYKIDPSKFAPSGGGGDQPKVRSLGKAFVESGGREAQLQKVQKTFLFEDVDPAATLGMKTTMTQAAGWAPQAVRENIVILDEQRPVEVTDLFPVFPTTQIAAVYMEETTFTNPAAERAENASYAEAALALTERSESIRSVGVSLPVTDEQLADIVGIQGYLDGRVPFMVRQRLDSQLLVGNGTPPNIRGTLNVAGIQTRAKGADTTLDAIYKAMDDVLVTGRAQPSHTIIHPTNFQPVRLLKTADGIYIWGPPNAVGPDFIFGLPVVKTTAVTLNTAIVGDYTRYSGLFMRQGMDMQTGYVSNDFLQGRVTIRAGVRVAAVHFRPTAFCTVTGLP